MCFNIISTWSVIWELMISRNFHCSNNCCSRLCFYQTRSAWSMDQGSNRKHSAVHNFAPTVTKFCVMWEGQALPHDTKFNNCRCEILGRRVIFISSLIPGSSWSGMIKAEPGSLGGQGCVSNLYHEIYCCLWVPLFDTIPSVLESVGVCAISVNRTCQVQWHRYLDFKATSKFLLKFNLFRPGQNGRHFANGGTRLDLTWSNYDQMLWPYLPISNTSDHTNPRLPILSPHSRHLPTPIHPTAPTPSPHHPPPPHQPCPPNSTISHHTNPISQSPHPLTIPTPFPHPPLPPHHPHIPQPHPYSPHHPHLHISTPSHHINSISPPPPPLTTPTPSPHPHLLSLHPNSPPPIPYHHIKSSPHIQPPLTTQTPSPHPHPSHHPNRISPSPPPVTTPTVSPHPHPLSPPQPHLPIPTPLTTPTVSLHPHLLSPPQPHLLIHTPSHHLNRVSPSPPLSPPNRISPFPPPLATPTASPQPQPLSPPQLHLPIPTPLTPSYPLFPSQPLFTPFPHLQPLFPSPLLLILTLSHHIGPPRPQHVSSHDRPSSGVHSPPTPPRFLHIARCPDG